MRRAGAAMAGAAVVLALVACSPGQSEPDGPAVSTLKANVASFVLSGNWNPVTSTYLNAFNPPQLAVYESLIQLNPATFEWEPLLAEEYEISEDQLSMTMKLREDVDFTDGTHFDAEAAKKSFDYALEGSTAVSLTAFEPTVEVTGEYEIVFHTTKAMGTDFLFWFGIVPIASPTAIEEDPTGLEKIPVGTGPYVLAEQVPDVSVRFERNPDYRDPESFPFDAVEFTVFDDPIAVSNALKSGQLNAATIDLSYAADVESNGFTLHRGVGGHAVIIWSDTEGEIVPQLADVRVRQAIALAIDRPAIIENLEYGFGTVTSQPWGEGSGYYIEGADDTYTYDLERARELMKEAGYEDGFSITMPTFADLAVYEPVIIQSFADIGITVTFEQYPDVFAFFTAAGAGDFTATAGQSEYAMWFRTTSDLFLSLDARNGPQEIRDLYEVVDNGTVQEAADATREIGQRVLDEAYIIALSRPAAIWATIPEITVDSAVVSWPVILRGFQLAD